MRTFENLVQGGDIRKRSPIISVGTVKAGNNVDLGSVNTTPEEFRNGGFTLKAHEMFYDHTSETLRLRNLKTQQSPVISDLCLRKSHDYRDEIVFEKLRFPNVFRPHQIAKPAFSKSVSVFVTD